MKRNHIDSNQSNNFVRFDEENDGLIPIANSEKTSTTIKLQPQDRPAFFMLVILYMLQGVPVGLAFGSIPFLLKAKLSYSQVGVFSLAAYPYSLKLLWSPIVDALYSPKIGRRKSWIIPIQTISGLTLIYLGSFIDSILENPQDHLSTITGCFFMLVFFCATQDIAVDGWALTCLSKDSLSYASTAQTIGMNTGYFSSFTIFLALSSPDFVNKYIRSAANAKPEPLITLGSYLFIWGWMFLFVTFLVFFVPEQPSHLQTLSAPFTTEKQLYNHPKSTWEELKNVYVAMYHVLKLRNVQMLILILLIAKFGFQVNEAATNLKLIEKGLSKEDLSISVLINFPFEMFIGYYAGTWAQGKSPLKPWIYGFAGRLLVALAAQVLVYCFPSDGVVTPTYFAAIILHHLLLSFVLTVQFVSLCAFFNTIADPVIGGTYMTTLNTVSNFGGTWPRFFIFVLIDKFTDAVCLTGSVVLNEIDKETCVKAGGHVNVFRDGYYYANFICVACGAIILIWVRKKAIYLQSLPPSAWRMKGQD